MKWPLCGKYFVLNHGLNSVENGKEKLTHERNNQQDNVQGINRY